jgi:UMF1 family MFS transporter
MSETAVGDNKRAIAAWCLYDWGNSAFTTLVVTFVYATYFTRAFAPNELIGTTYWSYGIGVSAIIVALLSPVLGAIADRGGRRRRYLMISTVACVLATAALTFVKPGGERAILLALTIFVIANVAFEVGMVFYNAFLPSLVPQAKIGRVSGYGWGLGYVGGLVSMFLGLFAFVGFDPNPGWLGISSAEGLHARSTNLLVAGWFLVFSLPLFAFVREDRKPSERIEVRKALSDLKWTFHEIRRYREIAKFLLARLVYNDGLVTIFALGGVYAIGTFGFTLAEVMVFGIVINITAGCDASAHEGLAVGGSHGDRHLCRAQPICLPVFDGTVRTCAKTVGILRLFCIFGKVHLVPRPNSLRNGHERVRNAARRCGNGSRVLRGRGFIAPDRQ